MNQPISWRKPIYWAAVIVFLVSLAWVTGVSAQDEGNLYNTAVDVRLGERYFLRQCSRCHGQDARGSDETGAPDLTGTLSRASSDAGVYRIIREGISGTAMLPVPQDTPDPTVWQLVAFINSLRTDPANIDLPGSVTAGRTVYLGKGECASCHMVRGAGGRLGPDLTLIGEELTPDELYTALTDPSADVDPRWWSVSVVLQDGAEVEGLRMNEDTFGLRIMDSQSNLWSFQKNNLRSYQRDESSTMPNYAETLSASEIDDLVAYLFSLRREN